MKTALVVLTFDPPSDSVLQKSYEEAVWQKILPTFFSVDGFIDFRSQRGGPETPVAYMSLTFVDKAAADAFLASDAFAAGTDYMRDVGCTTITARAFGPSPFLEGAIRASDLPKAAEVA